MEGARLKAPLFAVVALATCVVMLAGAPRVAFAADVEQLGTAYTDALRGYQDALAEQGQNADEIEAIERDIVAAEAAIVRAQNELGETAVAWYKGTRSGSVLVELLLGSSSFQDAVNRYELYEKVEDRCADRIDELAAERDGLNVQKAELEARKAEIEERVAEAKQAADDAQRALLDATHSDGAQFHQTQGNWSNCGATAFIVAVNMLLHENRFVDNIEVWKDESFSSDSTVNLAAKGSVWLALNGLGDIIGIEEVPGDVTTTAQLKELLDDGKLVVISSGSDSEWQLADGTTADKDAHSSGHWVVFYRCEGGIFFCNDSSASTDKGAGCPYTEEQMQQWLDGRSYHLATVLYLK